MFKELSNSDLCCITRINSEYANSGFPFKLAEYLSFGKPILSTSVSDIPLLFTDKKNILLAEPGNPVSISQVMEYALKNQHEIVQIGKNGNKICNNIFSIENIGEKLSEFVLRLS
jgi:glycosyltransferase involved in cell wall biosynthesis